MKKIVKSIASIIILPALYFILISAFTERESVSKKPLETGSLTDTTRFINMIMNLSRGYGGDDDKWVLQNVDNYKELGFNSVHTYPQDDSLYGIFPVQLNSEQTANIQNLISTVQNGNLKFFYEHVFFSYLCYAQRLIYEVPLSNGNNTANNGFCYTNVSAAPSIDSGRTVLYSPQRTNHEPELLCSGIYENLQHSDFFGRQYDRNEWYLKPMVRAILTSIHDTVPVFKIDVIRFNGEIDTSIIITAFNFRFNGSYNGEYIDNFYRSQLQQNLTFSGDTLTGINKGRNWKPLDSCSVDFKIYTYGYVDFWFDKLTVDDGYANDLFKNTYDYLFPDLLNVTNGGGSELYSLYMDEVTYSQLPCVKYVMDKINAHNSSIKFMVSESNWMNHNTTRRKTLEHKVMLSYLQPGALNAFSYELYHFGEGDTTCYVPAFAFNSSDIHEKIPSQWKTNNYNLYTWSLQNRIFGDKITAGGAGIHPQGTFIYQMAMARKNIDSCSPNTFLYSNPQVYGQMWINDNNHLEGIIEPTNEEGGAQLMLSLAHGADGLLWYIYQTDDDVTKDNIKCIADNYSDDRTYIIMGLYGKNEGIPEKERIKNLYSQNKWEYYKNLNVKINNWIPTLDKIYWQEGYSVHQEGVTHYYINDIKSIYRNSQGTLAEGPSCINCDNTKYWEEGFFEPKDQTDKSRYLLMVNRRCAPEVNGINLGDIRQLKIQFKPSELTGFNNWKLINTENNSVITTFDKNSNAFVDAGEFQPGEGKIFKLAPVMQEGGTFVCDENVTAANFNCNGVVYTGGYDLLVPAAGGQTTISFHPNAFIQAENGENIEFGQYNNVVLKAQNGGKWKGLYINNYYYTDFNNTAFENIGDANNTAYWSISMNDCPNVNINECNFSLPDKAKGINLNNYSLGDVSSNIVLTDNIININDATAAVFIGCSANGVNDVLIFDNTITNGSQASTYGILISNGYAPYIDGNTISGFNYGIELINTIAEMESNNINCYRNNTTGILAVSSSTINMGNIGDLVVGGNNVIINKGTDCKNVSLNNSVFEMNYGSNSFEVNNTQGNFNLTGNGNFHPGDDGPILFIEVIGNCFNGEGYFARDSVTELNGTKDSLLELPHYCTIQQDMIVDFLVPVTSNITDTVYKSSIPECQNGTPAELLNKKFNKNLLKRNYDSTKILGLQILTNYTDSVFVPNIISQLYFAYTRLGNISTDIPALKTFLEQLILNHSGNLSLVRSANYYIQKCKVHLHQYTSALDGYQDIIVQSPYSYEGLLASWDYAATLLLANSGGAYSYDNTENLNSLILESQFLVDSL
jgi:hypothetical protein